MQILAHRGYWQRPDEKNSRRAFLRSFELGFGVETDVRDLAGNLVIAHDPPLPTCLHLIDFLGLPGASQQPLALNIKSDGLAELLKTAMQGIQNWFVFDMSVPDMRDHLRVGNPVFTRMSEIERNPLLPDQAMGVWLDAFENEWYSMDIVSDLLQRKKKVCIVSPELHGRNEVALWSSLRRLSGARDLMICTDYPEKAREFFGVGQ